MNQLSLLKLLVLSVFIGGCFRPTTQNTRNVFYQNEANAIINTAELALLTNDLSVAKSHYEKVVKMNVPLFTKDINNILIVAAELKEADLFYLLLDQLLDKNIGNEALVDKFGSYELTKDKRWEQFLEKNEAHQVKKPALRVMIDSLLMADQEFRKKEGSYRLYGDTIRKIDSMNMELLFSLMKNDVFPSEFEIGAKGLSGTVGWEVILHHYAQSTSIIKDKPKITALLVDLAQKRKIMPNQVAYLIDLQGGEVALGAFDVMALKGIGDPTILYAPKYTELQRISIDAARRLVGAEPLDDYYQKVRFRWLYPENKFEFNVFRSVWEADESLYKKLEMEWNKIGG